MNLKPKYVKLNAIGGFFNKNDLGCAHSTYLKNFKKEFNIQSSNTQRFSKRCQAYNQEQNE